MAKYLMEMRQGDDSVAQDFENVKVMLHIIEAMLKGSCEVEYLISKINSDEEENFFDDDIWYSKRESRNGE